MKWEKIERVVLNKGVFSVLVYGGSLCFLGYPLYQKVFMIFIGVALFVLMILFVVVAAILEKYNQPPHHSHGYRRHERMRVDWWDKYREEH